MQPGDLDIHVKIKRLAAVRRALGWSEELCAHHLGVTYSTLNRWERGESLPKSLVVLKTIDRFIAKHGKTLSAGGNESGAGGSLEGPFNQGGLVP